MDGRRRQSLARLREDDIAARRERLATVSMEARLLETIAWSAALLADEASRTTAWKKPLDRPLPTGLGARLS